MIKARKGGREGLPGMIANHPYITKFEIKVNHVDYQYLPIAQFSITGKVYAGQQMLRAILGAVRQHRRHLRNKARMVRCALKIATSIHIESEQRGVTTLWCTHEYIGFYKLSRKFKVIIEFR